MDSPLSLLLLSPYFLEPLAIASVVGFACYILAHWVEGKWPQVVRDIVLLIACLVVCFLFSSLPFGLIGIAALIAICWLSAFAERAISPAQTKESVFFLRMLFATVYCVLFSGMVLFVSLPVLPMPMTGPDTFLWFSWGSVMGALCSPSIIPLFIWVWRSSHLRPGVDRHLDSDEGLS